MARSPSGCIDPRRSEWIDTHDLEARMQFASDNLQELPILSALCSFVDASLAIENRIHDARFSGDGGHLQWIESSDTLVDYPVGFSSVL
jgi:hypothetical protein